MWLLGIATPTAIYNGGNFGAMILEHRWFESNTTDIMVKVLIKLIMPLALVLAACFGYTVGMGNPSWLLLILTVLVFLLDLGISFVMDKVTDFNFYKNTSVGLWHHLMK